MSRYVIVPMNQPVYDELEAAKREMEVRFLEDPGKRYLLAEVIATTENKLNFYFFEKEKKPRRKRSSKLMKEKAQLLQQLSDPGVPKVSFGPPTPGSFYKITPNPIVETVTINNPDVITTTTNSAEGVPFTYTQRCKFDNNLAVATMETDDGIAYLCAEHSV